VVPPSDITPITPGNPTETKNYWDMTAVPSNAQRVMTVDGIIVVLGGQKSYTKVDDVLTESTDAVWKDALRSKNFTVGDAKFTGYAESVDNARDLTGGASGDQVPFYNGFGKYTPTKPGKITIYFYVPDNKGVRFLEASTPATDAKGTNLLLGENPRANIYQGEGDDQKRVNLNADGVPQGITKGVGILTCDLKPGNVYYLALSGSKLGLGGFMYELDAQNGLEEVIVDENAPVEYYNLQGVRVANPENGLYIRRQGNKVEKVIL
ncbi:MAG: hypothetical protein K2K72_00190, partial [Duncaniella sp.]|nr:hypothetical protein [Duncaniella sp.]